MLLKNLDYETSPEHKLIVEASDGGKPRLTSTMKLTVNVHDVNDNPPVFSEPDGYNFNLNGGGDDGVVGLVKATDADAGRNGRVSYFVRDSEVFGVYPNSGAIYLNR